MLQKEVKVFKLIKYRDGYNDGAQGKPLRYPLGVKSLRTDQGTIEVLVPHASSNPDTFATATVVKASRDPSANEAPVEGQLAEACRDSEVDLAFRAAEAPHDIVSA